MIDQRTLSMRINVLLHKLSDVGHQVLMDEGVEDSALDEAAAVLQEVGRESMQLRAEVISHRQGRGARPEGGTNG